MGIHCGPKPDHCGENLAHWMSWWMCNYYPTDWMSTAVWEKLGSIVWEYYQPLCYPPITDDLPLVDACAGKECGPGLHWGSSCGECGPGEICADGACVCEPDCVNKQCGDDGCGGICGACPSPYECQEGTCVADCVDLCEGKECGKAGIENECICGSEECPEGYVCQEGECVEDCDALCEGKECGTAGAYNECNCGPLGGVCQEGYTCLWDGICEQDLQNCVAPCAGKKCGFVGTCSCEDVYWETIKGSYGAITYNPKVAQAMNLDQDDRQELETNIKKLECLGLDAIIPSWDELHELGTYSLTSEDVKKIWLRRLAVAFYHEVHETFPWTITDYTPEALTFLLGLHVSKEEENVGIPHFFENSDDAASDFVLWKDDLGPDFNTFKAVWAANPLRSWEVMKDVVDAYNPATPKEALFALVDYMRYLGWYHNDVAADFYGFEWSWYADHNIWFAPWEQSWSYYNFETFFEAKGSSCPQGVAIIKEGMRALNIPVLHELSYCGHSAARAFLFDATGPSCGQDSDCPPGQPCTGSGICAEELIMLDGDNIHSKSFRHMPAEHTFRTLPWYLANSQQGAGKLHFEHTKQAFLDWFQYYQHPAYGPILEEKFWEAWKKGETFPTADLEAPLASGCGSWPQILGEDCDIVEWLEVLEDYFGYEAQPITPCEEPEPL